VVLAHPGAPIVYGTEAPQRLNWKATVGATPLTAATTGWARAAPAIGRDDTIYVVTEARAVEAFDFALSRLWTMTITTLASFALFDVAPTLDCARVGGVPVARPGTLYVVGPGDPNVYALIVDSHGLDVLSPWPKFQHDGRNSGNTAGVIQSCP
jgi:hypothetical protein